MRKNFSKMKKVLSIIMCMVLLLGFIQMPVRATDATAVTLTPNGQAGNANVVYVTLSGLTTNQKYNPVDGYVKLNGETLNNKYELDYAFNYAGWGNVHYIQLTHIDTSKTLTFEEGSVLTIGGTFKGATDGTVIDIAEVNLKCTSPTAAWSLYTPPTEVTLTPDGTAGTASVVYVTLSGLTTNQKYKPVDGYVKLNGEILNNTYEKDYAFSYAGWGSAHYIQLTHLDDSKTLTFEEGSVLTIGGTFKGASDGTVIHIAEVSLLCTSPTAAWSVALENIYDITLEPNNEYNRENVTHVSVTNTPGSSFETYKNFRPGAYNGTVSLNDVALTEGTDYAFMTSFSPNSLFSIQLLNGETWEWGDQLTISGKFVYNRSSEGINVASFTMWYDGSKWTTTEDAFKSAVYCNLNTDSYTITDAETVTIDGTLYSYGDICSVIGTHTLTYLIHNREYSRKLVIYRTGEVSDSDRVDIYDLVRMKKALAGVVNLTESGALGADMNNSGAVDVNDASLLRKYLVMSSGVLILCPADNAAAGEPSEAVAALTANYDPAACKSAGLKNGEDIYFRNALTVNWISFENVSEYQVLLATEANLNGAMTYTTTVPSLSLMNLLPDTTYYWAVRAGDYTTATRTFTTADTVRTLTVEGVSNTRDIGGYAAANGKRVRYGMVYRGGKLNDITEEGLYQMMTVLGIKTDLDLRTPGEGGAGGDSPLGSSVNYYNYNAPYYWNDSSGLLAESYKETLISEIRTFADQDNYPIYVHCSIGRDRTGTILFLINGLLGVSKEDLYLDYELSFLSASGGSDSANVPVMIKYVDDMYNGIQSYAQEGTFADACEAFILSLGITQDEINTIRTLMLEDR